MWPWIDREGRPLPSEEGTLTPELAGLCFFTLLAQAASERRSRGGPSGGLSPALADAGFGSSEWLPDRTDDLAVRLLSAGSAVPRAELLQAVSALARATLGPGGAPAISALRLLGIPLENGEMERMLEGARIRLPDLARWLEENGRELLERA
jgi:hypothetical protein